MRRLVEVPLLWWSQFYQCVLLWQWLEPTSDTAKTQSQLKTTLRMSPMKI
uniref:Uncharacterized protein n=1 Tax=Anguilla anguilla TaxID=7936 RepID=A0A0E9RBC8_ANGAN